MHLSRMVFLCTWLALAVGVTPLAAVTISPPSSAPTSINANQSTVVTVSAKIVLNAGESIPQGAVNLLRITASGPIVVGVMNDSGTSGDVIAGDGVYTIQTTFTEGGSLPLDLQVSAAVRGSLRRSLSTVVSIPIVGAANSSTINITVATVDYSKPDHIGSIAGPGVLIKANGVLLGSTDEAGQFVATLTPGRYELEARIPSQAVGLYSLNATAGSQQTITIPLDFDKEVTEDATQTIDEAVGLLFPSTSSTLTLRLRTSTTPILVSQIGSIELHDEEGRFVASGEQFFSVQPDGSVRATASSLAALLSSQPKMIRLQSELIAEDGLTYSAETDFYYAHYALSGTLVPPPSFPTLPIQGIQVSMKVLQTPITLVATTDSNGHFSFPLLPTGLLELSATILNNGKFYNGFAQFILDRPRSVNVTMLTDVDLRNQVPPFVLSNVQAGLFSSIAPLASIVATPHVSSSVLPPWLEQAQAHSLSSRSLSTLATSPTSVTVTTINGQQDVPITHSATLTVPQGTKKLTLTYNVFSQEYFCCIPSQSIFNDVWYVRVVAEGTGQQLFQINRNVNSQLFIDPIWQPDGSTGDQVVEIPIEGLAATQDAAVSVYVSSTNIGDSIVNTSVTATLDTSSPVSITSLTAEPVSDADGPGAISTKGDNRSYSIPRSAMLNTFQRAFQVAITKPDGATVKNVEVDLTTSAGSDLQTKLVNEGPSAAGPVQIVDDNTLLVYVTMRQTPSTVSSQPPPTDKISYRFKVTANSAGTDMTSPPKLSSELRPLWRMPDGIKRFSPSGISPTDAGRDLGGDDWSLQQTYTWLIANSSKITSVNDISGEHGRYIGHKTHTRGSDVDIFQFYTFPGAVSGDQNYSALRTAVITAFQGDTAAKARVAAWASAMRSGLNTLAATAGVAQLRTSYGRKTPFAVTTTGTPPAIPDGWAKELLESGTVTSTGAGKIDFGVGKWSRTCSSGQTVVCDPGWIHDNHVHITLSY